MNALELELESLRLPGGGLDALGILQRVLGQDRKGCRASLTKKREGEPGLKDLSTATVSSGHAVPIITSRAQLNLLLGQYKATGGPHIAHETSLFT